MADPANALRRAFGGERREPTRLVVDGLFDGKSYRQGRAVLTIREDVLESVVRFDGHPPGEDAVALHDVVACAGLTDVHTHVTKYADEVARPGFVDVRNTYQNIAGIDDVVDLLADADRQLAPEVWVRGLASPTEQYRASGGRLLGREDLDRISRKRPIVLSYGAHITCANTPAISRWVAQTGRSPDSEVFYETEQLDLLRLAHRSSPVTARDRRQSLVERLHECAARGVTCVHAIVRNPEEIRMVVELQQADELPVAVVLVPRVQEAAFAEMAFVDVGLPTGFGSADVVLGGMKVSLDGAGEAGAFRPLGDAPPAHPIWRIDRGTLERIAQGQAEGGSRMLLHAIGDEAIDLAIEVLSGLPRPASGPGHRVEHFGNWMMTTSRVEKARDAGLVAVPNPPFFYYHIDALRPVLGEQRLEDCLPLRRLIDTGLAVGLGSDGPNYWPIDPLREARFEADRLDRSGRRIPGELLDPELALRLVTSDAAALSGRPRCSGRVTAGERADLVLLKPLASGDAAGLLDPATEVVGTVRNGHLTYVIGDGRAGPKGA